MSLGLINNENVQKVKKILIEENLKDNIIIEKDKLELQLGIDELTMAMEASYLGSCYFRMFGRSFKYNNDVENMKIKDKVYRMFMCVGPWKKQNKECESYVVLGANYKQFGNDFSEFDLSDCLEDNEYIYIVKNLSKLAGSSAITRLNKGIKSDRDKKYERRRMLVSQLNFETLDYDKSEWLCIAKINKSELENKEKYNEILRNFLNNFIEYSLKVEEIISQ